jgi:hypothetical protein
MADFHSRAAFQWHLASWMARKRAPAALLPLLARAAWAGFVAVDLRRTIQTPVPATAAREKLEELDEEWWLDALLRAEGRLNIALEYVRCSTGRRQFVHRHPKIGARQSCDIAAAGRVILHSPRGGRRR